MVLRISISSFVDLMQELWERYGVIRRLIVFVSWYRHLKLERILIKSYGENVSLLFNQTSLNERLLPNYTHTHIYIYIYIYI